MDEAQNQGLTVGGHLPLMTLTTRDAIRGGVRFIEHAQYYVLGGCSRSEKQIDDEFVARLGSKSPMGFTEVAYRYAETFDERWAEELAGELLEHNVWVTPTLAVLRQAESMGRVNYDEHPQRKYVFAGIWRTWDLKEGRRHPMTDARRRPSCRLGVRCIEQLHLPRLDSSQGTGTASRERALTDASTTGCHREPRSIPW